MNGALRQLTYEDHRQQMDALRYVYPVLSRRARGVSIGINLNPDKVCNFDCVYCQVDRQEPGVRGIELSEIERELSMLLQWVADGSLFSQAPFDTVPPHLRRVNDVCFAGDGEPTSVPEFLDTVRMVIDLKAKFKLDELKIVLITNSTLLHRKRVRDALALMDQSNGEVWAKLDAGTEAYYHRVDVTRVPFRRILSNLLEVSQQRPMVIQTMLLDLGDGGPSEQELKAYARRLQHVIAQGGQLKLVQLYSVARKPPLSGVYSLTDARLEAIAEWLRGQVSVPVETFPGSSMFLPPEQASMPV